MLQENILHLETHPANVYFYLYITKQEEANYIENKENIYDNKTDSAGKKDSDLMMIDSLEEEEQVPKHKYSKKGLKKKKSTNFA